MPPLTPHRSALARSAGFLLVAALSWGVGCSSSSGASTPLPCNENPWECQAGQTCWPKDPTTFACLNSGAGKVGDACLDAVGSPTCGDGLACLQLTSSDGTCAAYCSKTDPSRACPSGQTCTALTLLGVGGLQFQVCVATVSISTPADAGSEAAGPTDAGVPAGDGSASAACTAWANHEVAAACPGTTAASTIITCQQGESLYPPEGCGAAWQAYVACATQAPYSCANGPTGCDTQQNAYFACQSAFASSSGCTRLGANNDAKCAAATPYAFGCLSSLPTGCVVLPTSSSATIACCPAFPAR